MHVEHENNLREVCFRPLSTSHHRRHRTPPKRAFMLVFGVLTFSGHHHNDDNAENTGDGCGSPILQQGTFSFENIYLLTISSLPTVTGVTLAHPTPILSTTRRGPPCHINTTSSLENEHVCSFSRLVPFYHHHPSSSLPPPPPFSFENEHVCSFSRLVALCHHHHSPSKTSVRACFRGQLFFATTTTTSLLPRKQACTLVFEHSCSLPPPPPFSLENKRVCLFSRTVVLCQLPPPFSLENKRVRLFSRTVVLCHYHHPPPSKTSICAHFRDWMLFITIPRRQARTLVFEGSCSLPSLPPSSLENEHTRSFSRLVALCHHSLEDEHIHSFSRVFNFLNVYNIINNIYFYFIWF